MPFHTYATLPKRQIFEGISGRYAHTERLTAGEVELEAGAAVPIHRHPHEQLTYVIAGRLEFMIDEAVTVLEPGMCALVPANAPHRVRALTACRVLDVFTPPRDDYR